MVLHLEKTAIRALGIAESFREREEYSTIAGVVMRSDLVIDGFQFAKSKVGGEDATGAILELFKELGRNDINSLLVSGSVLSIYNIVDIDKIHRRLRVPVIALSFKKSKSDLGRNILRRFPKKQAEAKIKLLEKLGQPITLRLRTGYNIFARTSGISEDSAKKLVDKFTLQGAVPEPIRVARLLARSAETLAR